MSFIAVANLWQVAPLFAQGSISSPISGPILPSPSPTPPVSSPITPSITITFNDLRPAILPLNGQYPAGIIDWGQSQWLTSGPWGKFKTNSISTLKGVNSGNFRFIFPKKLISFQAYNGGWKNSLITVSCNGNPNVAVIAKRNKVTTIQTNWQQSCDRVTITSSNDWWTNFDNLVIQ